jgi:hypothetical protein
MLNKEEECSIQFNSKKGEIEWFQKNILGLVGLSDKGHDG